MEKYFGKYRGTVLNNADPMQMGRLMAQVPDVSNVLPGTWAMPCVPFAGNQAGQLVVPSIGAGVWIEFEQGNPDFPIWTGCFWGSAGELPALALAVPPATQQLVIQTMLQTTLVVSDMPGPTGGILLKTAAGAQIAINDTGITISNGQGATIVLAGPSVTVNDGALVVT